MPQKFDEASYNKGRAAFATGASLRSIVEAVMNARTPPDEAKTMSAALGFADALLDLLRNPTTIANATPLIQEND